MTKARIIHKNRQPAPTGKAMPMTQAQVEARLKYLDDTPLNELDWSLMEQDLRHLDAILDDHWKQITEDPEFRAMYHEYDAQRRRAEVEAAYQQRLIQIAGDLPVIEQRFGGPRPTGSYTTNVGTHVYVAYDKNNHVLYVGATDDLFARMASHRRGSEWWPHMARLTWEEWPNRTTALHKELTLIRRYRPPYNKTGNPDAKDNR